MYTKPSREQSIGDGARLVSLMNRRDAEARAIAASASSSRSGGYGAVGASNISASAGKGAASQAPSAAGRRGLQDIYESEHTYVTAYRPTQSEQKLLFASKKGSGRDAGGDEDRGLLNPEGPAVNRCVRGNRRTCLIAAAAIVVLAAVGVPTGIYVAAPYIAGRALSSASLEFLSLNLTQPRSSDSAWRPSTAAGYGGGSLRVRDIRRSTTAAGDNGGVDDGDDAGAFTLSVRALLGNLPISGTISDVPLTLSIGGTDVCVFTLPGQTASAGATVEIDATVGVQVISAEAFGLFAAALLQSQAVSVGLKGTASVSTTIAGLSISINGVPFDKTASIAGADGLKGAQVTNFDLSLSNATTAIVNMTVAIPNVAPVGVYPLGPFGVEVYYQGYYMGRASSDDVSLSLIAGGINTVSMVGILNPGSDAGSLAAAGALISDYLGGKSVAVSAVGVPLPSSFPVYGPFISALSLSAQLNGTDTPLVQAITVHSLSLVPLSASQLSVSMNATVSINSPLGANSPISVRGVGLNVSLEGGGAIVGSLYIPLPPMMSDVSPSSAASSSALSRRLPSASSGASTSNREVARFSGSGSSSALVNETLSIEGAILTIDSSGSAFGDFIKQFINQPSVTLGLVGTSPSALSVALSSALGDVTVSVPITARTSVAGINGFSSVEVRSFSVLGVSNPPGGPAAILVELNVAIGNPSTTSFPLGDTTTLGIYSSGFRIGSAVAVNETLRPGINVMALNGTLTPPPESLPEASRFFSNYLNGLNGTVTVVGENVSLGNDTPQWLIDAVRNISLAAVLPGAVDLTVLTDLTFQRLDLSFATPSPAPPASSRALSPSAAASEVMGSSAVTGAAPAVAAVPVMGGLIAAAVHLPFSIPVDIPSANISLTLRNVSTGAPFAQLVILNQPATFTPCNGSTVSSSSSDVSGSSGYGASLSALCAQSVSSSSASGNAPVVGTLTMTLQPTMVTVLDDAAMAALISSVLLTSGVDVLITGTADPVVSTAVGALSISNVSVSQIVSIAGMAGFSSSPPVVYDVNITHTSESGLDITVKLSLVNPSNVHGSLGPVQLDIAYLGQTITSATVDDMEVWPGNNTLSARSTVVLPDPVAEPSRYAAAKGFISRYLSSMVTDVTLLGSNVSSAIALLAPALSAFRVGSVFPPLDPPLLVNGTLYVNYTLGQPIPNKANGSLFMTNAMSAPLQLREAAITLFMCGDQNVTTRKCKQPWGNGVGYFYDGNLSEARSGFPTVAARSTQSTYSYEMKLIGNAFDDIIVFGEAALGGAVAKANGTITVAVGDYVVKDMFFQQEGILLFTGSDNQAPFPPAPLLLEPPPSEVLGENSGRGQRVPLAEPHADMIGAAEPESSFPRGPER